MEFAHTFKSTSDLVIDNGARHTLVCHMADGTIGTVNSKELPALESRDNAISRAMFSVSDYQEVCELYWYGEYCGEAKYVNTTPGSFFESMHVVFSTELGI